MSLIRPALDPGRRGARVGALLFACFLLSACVFNEGEVTTLPSIAAGGVINPGALVEVAQAVEAIGPINSPEKVLQLMQMKFDRLTLAFLKRLPEYQAKRKVIAQKAETKRVTIRRTVREPKQQRQQLAQVDKEEKQEESDLIANMLSDPKWVSKAAKMAQDYVGSNFYTPDTASEGAVALLTVNKGNVELADNRVWRTDTNPDNTKRDEVLLAGETYSGESKLELAINNVERSNEDSL